MYDNLSVMAVLPPDQLHETADAAEGLLRLMEKGDVEFDAHAWNLAQTFLRDCRVHAMGLAQTHGMTNVPSSVFPFPP